MNGKSIWKNEMRLRLKERRVKDGIERYECDCDISPVDLYYFSMIMYINVNTKSIILIMCIRECILIDCVYNNRIKI